MGRASERLWLSSNLVVPRMFDQHQKTLGVPIWIVAQRERGRRVSTFYEELRPLGHRANGILSRRKSARRWYQYALHRVRYNFINMIELLAYSCENFVKVRWSDGTPSAEYAYSRFW